MLLVNKYFFKCLQIQDVVPDPHQSCGPYKPKPGLG